MFHTLSHVFSFRLLFWEHSESVTRIGQCRPCPIGTVNNGTGNVECSFCSDGLTTVSVGSVAGDCAVEELDEAPTFLVILIASVIVGCVLCGLLSLRGLQVGAGVPSVAPDHSGDESTEATCVNTRRGWVVR